MKQCPKCSKEWEDDTEQVACIDIHGKCIACMVPDLTMDLDAISKLAAARKAQNKSKQYVEEAPYHPGYEDAVIKEDNKVNSISIKRSVTTDFAPALRFDGVIFDFATVLTEEQRINAEEIIFALNKLLDK